MSEEKDILEEDFDSVRNGILLMESRLQTEKILIDSEVQEVGSMRNFHQSMPEELCSGINILQEQDIHIVAEATDLFGGIRAELEAQSKKITDNGLEIFVQKVSIQAVPKSIGVLSIRIDEVVKVISHHYGVNENNPIKSRIMSASSRDGRNIGPDGGSQYESDYSDGII
jgi:hypothetical protein